MRFFLLFILLLPFVEIWSMIEVGARIGSIPTIGLLIFDILVGAALLRRGGVNTLMRINQKLVAGEVPTREVLNGLLLAAGGILLVIPGFVTDLFALCCLLPPTRYVLLWLMLRHPAMMHVQMMTSQRPPSPTANVYEGEYHQASKDDLTLPPGQS